MTTTKIDITARDLTAQAFSSANQSLASLAGNIAGITAAFVGAGLSVNSFTNTIKQVADVGDRLNDLRKISGLTIEQLGGLEKQAKLNGSSLEQVAKAIGVMSKNMYAGADAFKALGIQTQASDGSLRDVNAVLLEVADRFSRMRDGAERSAIANQLFGKSGRELIPMLNEGRGAIEAATAAYAKNSGMTQKMAEDSDRFNDILVLLGGRVTAIKNTFVGELLPTLNNIGAAMLSATDGTNKFSFAAQVAVPVLKGLAVAAYTVVDTFKGMGREIGARAAQLAALASMDFSGAKFIGQSLAEDNAKSRAEYDKFVNTVINGEKQISSSVDAGTKSFDFQAQSIGKLEKQAKSFNIEIYKLKGYQAELASAREAEYQKLKQHEDVLKRAAQITQSVATKQEIYNQTLEELNRLKPYLSVEAYTRALDKAEKELNSVTRSTQIATDEMSQMWMQAGRNIQNALGNMVFDFFNGGLDNMVSNVKNAVLRIASEFAGLRIAQGLGLAGMFTAGGAAASTGTAAGGGISALNIASLGSSALGLLKGGFGTMGMLSGAGSMLPGAAGSFFAGMGVTGTQAAAQAGATALWGASGASTAATMGASFASIAGPAIAIAAVDQITRLLAGDKMIGGGVGKVLNYVPVLGPLLNGLFGRGPMKQQGTLLSGEIGAEGFESGYLQTRFKAKGGLFRSDKIDYARVDAMTGEIWTDNDKLLDFAKELSKTGKELFGLINDTTKQTSSSLRQIGADLGLSTEGIDNFKHSINLLSEKGKMLTEEQIGQEIEKITDGLAHSLLPQVDELAKRGETALQAVSRLGLEFTTLVDTVSILMGKSVADSREFVKGASFEDRTAFVDKAGGVDALNQQVSFFANNFLTAAEKIAPAQEKLNEQLTKLGVNTDITKEQFRDLVMSVGKVGGVSADTALELLKLAPAFVAVTDALGTINNSKVLRDLSSDLDDAIIGLNARERALNQIMGEIGNLEEPAKSLADRLRETQAGIDDLEGSLANLLGTATKTPLQTLTDMLGVKDSLVGFRESLGNTIFDARLAGADPSRQAQMLKTLESQLYAKLDTAADPAAIAQQLQDVIVKRIQAEALARQNAQNAEFARLNEIAKLSDDARQTQIDLLRDQIDGMERMRDLAQDIKQYVGSLKFSDLSVLHPDQQLASARSLFEQTLAAARGGDTNAMSNLTGNAQAYLTEAQGYYGGATSPYASIFGAVTSSLDALGLSANNVDSQMTALQAQIDALESINSAQSRLESVTIDTSGQEVAALTQLDDRIGGLIERQDTRIETQIQLVRDQIAELVQIKEGINAQIKQKLGFADQLLEDIGLLKADIKDMKKDLALNGAAA